MLLAAGLLRAEGQVRISEFMADNMSVLEDADESTVDWIELENTGGGAVDLTGWGLSDDPGDPGQWEFPAVSLGAGQRMVIFASGKDWRVPGVELHTNFKLSASSDSLVLSQPDGSGGWVERDRIADYPRQRTDISFGRSTEAGGAWGYYEAPTPGAGNAGAQVAGFAAEPSISVPRGYKEAAFNVAISSSTPGASLIYTTDGTRPTPSNGVVVPPGPEGLASTTLAITDTTLVRTCATGGGWGSSEVITHSYIFAQSVLNQSASDVPGPYGNWGHAGPDWAMDASVTGNDNPEDRCVAEDFYKIPTVSIAMKWADLFGAETAQQAAGIYLKDEGIRKEASFELINPHGYDDDPNRSPSEFSRGQILVFGGSSTAKRWKTDKLSFRFNFEDKLTSVVFGNGATGRYDRLVLDARLNNVWTQAQNPEQRQFGDYVRDAVLSDLDNSLGRTGVHSQHVHLFLNGLYWGIYTLHERPDNHFAAAYFGGDSDDYDVVKHDPAASNFIVDGLRIDPRLPISNTNHTAAVNYLEMVARAARDLSVPANYAALAEVLDIAALRDHILTNFYGGNYDWPQHNWYATYNRVSGTGKWRFHSWDAEHVFKYEDYPRYDNVTNKFEGWNRPDGIHLQLLENPEYRMAFADAAHKYLFNGGAFSVERVWQLFENRFIDIDEAIRAESARWGDNGPLAGERHLRHSNVPNPNPAPYGQSDTTDFASWHHERDRIRLKILGPAPNRATRFLEQLRGAVYHEDHPKGNQPNPLYPSVDAPVFSRHGGALSETYALEMMTAGGGGVTYYTLDGSDPRLPGSGTTAFFSGAVDSGARVYDGPVEVSGTTVVRARTLQDGVWSALNEATFVRDGEATVPASAANLALSKIHYHPANPTTAEGAAGFLDDGDFEYLEVVNYSTDTIDLSGLRMADGIESEWLADGTMILSPGARALIVSNREAFTFRNGPDLPIAGVFANGTALSNGGEQLVLLAADGSVIFDITYDDAAPWPVSPDGNGPALVAIQPGFREGTHPLDWRPSRDADGNPGSADGTTSFGDWMDGFIDPSDPDAASKRLPHTDVDGDGLTNLEERFLGTDPSVAGERLEWVRSFVAVRDLGSGLLPHSFLRLIFKHPAEGVGFRIEVSTDGIQWTSANEHLTLSDAILDEAGYQTREYRLSQTLSSAPLLWARVRLSP